MRSDLFGFAGKTAIVWGGGAGMGAATAILLASLGADIAVVDIDEAAATRVAAEIEATGRRSIGLCADVREERQITDAIDRACHAFGSLTLSASVVGVASFVPLIDMTVEQWDRDQTLNIRPAFLIGRAMARMVRAQGSGGAMVFVGSVSGMQAAISHGAYGAAKAALSHLVRTMATEWAPLGIRVNCLAPGAVATNRIRPSQSLSSVVRQRLPAGRFGTIEEMANGIIYLLSDLATYVTGTTLAVDGGWMSAPVVRPADGG